MGNVAFTKKEWSLVMGILNTIIQSLFSDIMAF